MAIGVTYQNTYSVYLGDASYTQCTFSNVTNLFLTNDTELIDCVIDECSISDSGSTSYNCYLRDCSSTSQVTIDKKENVFIDKGTFNILNFEGYFLSLYCVPDSVRYYNFNGWAKDSTIKFMDDNNGAPGFSRDFTYQAASGSTLKNSFIPDYSVSNFQVPVSNVDFKGYKNVNIVNNTNSSKKAVYGCEFSRSGTLKFEGVSLIVNSSLAFSPLTVESGSSVEIGNGTKADGCAIPSGMTFAGRRLRNLSMTDTSWGSADNINKKHFKDCDFRGADFTGATITNCIFENCNISGADFSGASSTSGTTFVNCVDSTYTPYPAVTSGWEEWDMTSSSTSRTVSPLSSYCVTFAPERSLCILDLTTAAVEYDCWVLTEEQANSINLQVSSGVTDYTNTEYLDNNSVKKLETIDSVLTLPVYIKQRLYLVVQNKTNSDLDISLTEKSLGTLDNDANTVLYYNFLSKLDGETTVPNEAMGGSSKDLTLDFAGHFSTENGLDLTGGNYGQTDTNVDLSGTFTIDVVFSSPSSVTSDLTLFSSLDETSFTGFRTKIENVNNFYYYSNTVGDTAENNVLDSFWGVKSDNRVRMQYINDGALVKVYRNGHLVGSRSSSTEDFRSGIPLYIGIDGNSGGSLPGTEFKGYIEEFAISNVARTPMEKVSDGLLENDNNTLVYYDFKNTSKYDTYVPNMALSSDDFSYTLEINEIGYVIEGQGLDLISGNGSTRRATANPIAGSLTGSFSIEAVVWLNSIPSTTAYLVSEKSFGPAAQGFSLGFGNISGDFGWRTEVADSSGVFVSTSSESSRLFKRMLVQSVFDASDSILRLYVDGVEVGSSDYTGNLPNMVNGALLDIGSTGAGSHFYGIIEEISISTVARPPKSLGDRLSFINDEDTRAYYDFRNTVDGSNVVYNIAEGRTPGTPYNLIASPSTNNYFDYYRGWDMSTSNRYGMIDVDVIDFIANNPFSIELVVSYDSNASYMCILSSLTGSNAGIQLRNSSGLDLEFKYSRAGGGTYYLMDYSYSERRFDQEFVIQILRESPTSAIEMYVNGERVSSRNESGGIIPNEATYLYVGAEFYWSLSNYFDGKIREISISDAYRAPVEDPNSLFKPINDKDTILYYDFSDISSYLSNAQVVKDTSISGGTRDLALNKSLDISDISEISESGVYFDRSTFGIADSILSDMDNSDFSIEMVLSSISPLSGDVIFSDSGGDATNVGIVCRMANSSNYQVSVSPSSSGYSNISGGLVSDDTITYQVTYRHVESKLKFYVNGKYVGVLTINPNFSDDPVGLRLGCYASSVSSNQNFFRGRIKHFAISKTVRKPRAYKGGSFSGDFPYAYRVPPAPEPPPVTTTFVNDANTLMYYDFTNVEDGSATATDIAVGGGSNTLTLDSAGTFSEAEGWDVTGGNHYGETNSLGPQIKNSSFSIEMIFKYNSTNNGDALAADIISDSGVGGWVLRAHGTEQIDFTMSNNGTWGGLQGGSLTTGTEYILQLIYDFSSKGVEMYIDGNLVASGSYPFPTLDQNSRTTLAAWDFGGLGNYMDGYIKEFCISNVTRSPITP